MTDLATSPTQPNDEESDLTARARLRNAAIRVIARDGPGQFTARRVAAEAGVSPGLIAHHFSSMAGLRRACDQHVARVLHEQDVESIEQGGTYDLVSALSSGESFRLLGYLAAVLSEPSDEVDALVDELIESAFSNLELAEQRGLVRPSRDPRRRAELFVLRTLGLLTLHRQVTRLTGVDPTDLAGAEPADVAALAAVSTELDGHGLYTDDYTEQLLAQLDPDTPR